MMFWDKKFLKFFRHADTQVFNTFQNIDFYHKNLDFLLNSTTLSSIIFELILLMFTTNTSPSLIILFDQ